MVSDPWLVEPDFDASALEISLLGEMASAGRDYLACRRSLTARGRTIAEEIAGDDLEAFTHYPRGDVYDPESHAQYYFHLHRLDDCGHFQAFLRAGGMPSGFSSTERPLCSVDQDKEPVAHLIAIGLDRRGEPGQLFTTNRWVTAESWYRGADITAMLPRFHISHGDPSPIANRWISAVVTLFRPSIAKLLEVRDDRVGGSAKTKGIASILEDRAFDVISAMNVDIDGHIARVEQALAERAGVIR